MAGKETGGRAFPHDEWGSASIVRGDSKKPWAVFIHGLGVDQRIWSAPDEARILGGLFPLQSIVRTGGELRTLYHDLAFAGFTTLAFSFKRPAGGIEEAVHALGSFLDRAGAEKPCGVVLVGHSRGGLIARKYLERRDPLIKGFVSIASPHEGATLARWAVMAKPAAALIKALQRSNFTGSKIGRESGIGVAIKRIIAFIESPAVAELLPDSGFFAGLEPPRTICPSVSVGGTDPRLFSFMGIGFPEVFERIIPGWAAPEEIRSGLGDGLVSARSSVYPYGREHLNFPVNHAETIFDGAVRAELVKRIIGFF